MTAEVAVLASQMAQTAGFPATSQTIHHPTRMKRMKIAPGKQSRRRDVNVRMGPESTADSVVIGLTWGPKDICVRWRGRERIPTQLLGGCWLSTELPWENTGCWQGMIPARPGGNRLTSPSPCPHVQNKKREPDV